MCARITGSGIVSSECTWGSAAGSDSDLHHKQIAGNPKSNSGHARLRRSVTVNKLSLWRRQFRRPEMTLLKSGMSDVTSGKGNESDLGNSIARAVTGNS